MATTFGPAYDSRLDGERIRTQRERLRCSMLMASDRGEWLALREISIRSGDGEASISAQLRHLRKNRFGGYRVEKRRRTTGTWEYRVLRPEPVEVYQAEMFGASPQPQRQER